MKKFIYLLLLLVLLTGAWSLVSRDKIQKNEAETPKGEYTTFRQSDLDFQFDYRSGPDGYVVKEGPISGEGAVRTLVLFEAEYYENLENVPEGGEGPPVILIRVFDNLKNLTPLTWATENPEKSNINLMIGETAEVVIGEAPAIRYRADGLYASENAIITHGGRVYILTGQFIDEESSIRYDFESILGSISFAAEPDNS